MWKPLSCSVSKNRLLNMPLIGTWFQPADSGGFGIRRMALDVEGN